MDMTVAVVAPQPPVIRFGGFAEATSESLQQLLLTYTTVCTTSDMDGGVGAQPTGNRFGGFAGSTSESLPLLLLT